MFIAAAPSYYECLIANVIRRVFRMIIIVLLPLVLLRSFVFMEAEIFHAVDFILRWIYFAIGLDRIILKMKLTQTRTHSAGIRQLLLMLISNIHKKY